MTPLRPTSAAGRIPATISPSEVSPCSLLHHKGRDSADHGAYHRDWPRNRSKTRPRNDSARCYSQSPYELLRDNSGMPGTSLMPKTRNRLVRPASPLPQASLRPNGHCRVHPVPVQMYSSMRQRPLLPQPRYLANALRVWQSGVVNTSEVANPTLCQNPKRGECPPRQEHRNTPPWGNGCSKYRRSVWR